MDCGYQNHKHSAQYEHTILVTETGIEVLTARILKKIYLVFYVIYFSEKLLQ